MRHELAPRPLGPDAEPLEDGGLVHEVLERLYREPPTDAGRPEEGTVEAWRDAAAALIREVAAEREWDLDAAGPRIRMARFEALIDRFLRRDAREEGGLRPDRELLEASFGEREDDRFAAAELGGFRLHGRIDRIDVAPDGRALIRDYKLSKKVTAAAKLVEEGKLQLPLYLLAARGFGIDPVGGLYSPLGATSEDRPRGLIDAEVKGELIPSATDLNVKTDFVDREAFDEILEDARARAAGHVAAIRGGAIDRSPRGGECPTLVRHGIDLQDRARRHGPRPGGRGGRGRGMSDTGFAATSSSASSGPPPRGTPRARSPSRALRAPATPEQAAAIDSRSRDVFLEAGAGTGKTRVLVERYCDAVDVDGVEPERILAFTFTERAAAEMRRRVGAELARRGDDADDPERRERLLAAARAGERAPITTIHGFCRRLLAAHPVAAGIDPRFRVLDADESARLAARGIRARDRIRSAPRTRRGPRRRRLPPPPRRG